MSKSGSKGCCGGCWAWLCCGCCCGGGGDDAYLEIQDQQRTAWREKYARLLNLATKSKAFRDGARLDAIFRVILRLYAHEVRRDSAANVGEPRTVRAGGSRPRRSGPEWKGDALSAVDRVVCPCCVGPVCTSAC